MWYYEPMPALARPLDPRGRIRQFSVGRCLIDYARVECDIGFTHAETVSRIVEAWRRARHLVCSEVRSAVASSSREGQERATLAITSRKSIRLLDAR
jgi:hypothetical protein